MKALVLIALPAALASWQPVEHRIALLWDEDCVAQLSNARRLRAADEDTELALRIVKRVPSNSRRSLMDAEVRDLLVAQLHLEIAKTLSPDNYRRLLRLEADGLVEEALELIGKEEEPIVDGSVLGAVYSKYGKMRRLGQKQEVPTPVVSDSEYLSSLDISWVDTHGLLKSSRLLRLAENVPCQKPEPDFWRQLSETEISEESRARHLRSLLKEYYALQHQIGENLSMAFDQATLDKRDALVDQVLEAQGISRSTIELLNTKAPAPGSLVETDVPLWYNGGFANNSTLVANSLDGMAVQPKLGFWRLQIPNDPLLAKQWYLGGPSQGFPFGLNAFSAWTYTVLNFGPAKNFKNGIIPWSEVVNLQYGMIVGVVDAGCGRNPDLDYAWYRKGSCAPGSFGQPATAQDPLGDCIGYDFGDDSQYPVGYGSEVAHGTETAALIGSTTNNGLGIASVCPNCRLLCLKLWAKAEQGISNSAILKALDYLIRRNVKLSNHSYGGPGYSDAEWRGFYAMAQRGLLTCFAAGNVGCDIDNYQTCRGSDYRPFTPAAYRLPNILNVGATDMNGKVPWFSNYGAKSVHLFAPGVDVLDIEPQPYNERPSSTNLPSKLVSGTSFSTPLTCGVAAHVWSLFPDLPYNRLMDIIAKFGTPNPQLVGKGIYPNNLNMFYATVAAHTQSA